jgi:ubiquinone/menaquinone biosynthesis C-methylase UbiE
MKHQWFIALVWLVGCHKPQPQEHQHPRGHSFESADDYAKRWNDPTRDQWQHPQEVISLLQITPGMAVADIGAGTGYFTTFLSQATGATGKVFALDVEPDMIRYLKERQKKEGWNNVEAKEVKTNDPLLPVGSIHRILIVNTWHHIWEREKYSAKLFEALASGGQLMIVDFTEESQMGPKTSEKLTAEQVSKELQSAGLSAEIISEGLPEQYIVVGKKP